MIYLLPIMLTFIISIGLSLLLMVSVEAPHKRKPKTTLDPASSPKEKMAFAKDFYKKHIPMKDNSFCKNMLMEGFYPDERFFCEFYYICFDDGRQYRRKCPKGKVFDKRTSQCETQISGKAGCPHLQSSGVHQPAQTRTPTPLAFIRVPQTHQLQTKNKPTTHSETNRGHETGPAKNQMIVAEALFRGRTPMKDNSFCKGKSTEGMYPDEASHCMYFYACFANGRQYRVKCEAGKLFNMGMGQCEKHINGKGCPHLRSVGPYLPSQSLGKFDTQQSQTKGDNFCVERRTGYHFDESTNCRNAYLCIDGNIQYKYQCKAGEVFDKPKQACRPGKGCPQSGKTLPLSAPSPTSPVTVRVPKLPAVALRGLTVPPRKTTLLIDYASDHAWQFCKGKKAGLHPDVTALCKGYYICRSHNHKPIYISCSSGRVFNDLCGWCEPENKVAKGCPIPEKQRTGVRRAPPPELPVEFCKDKKNGAYPDTDNGNKFYYYCNQGERYFVRRRCQLGWVFTVKDDKCMPI